MTSKAKQKIIIIKGRNKDYRQKYREGELFYMLTHLRECLRPDSLKEMFTSSLPNFYNTLHFRAIMTFSVRVVKKEPNLENLRKSQGLETTPQGEESRPCSLLGSRFLDLICCQILVKVKEIHGLSFQIGSSWKPLS